jgi:hypothetical protein
MRNGTPPPFPHSKSRRTPGPNRGSSAQTVLTTPGDKATSILELLGRNDQELATGLHAAAPGLATALDEKRGGASVAKSATVIDTAAIDVLDGRLYIAMRDLNKAARRAIRAGELRATPEEYQFHCLKPTPKPAKPATPPAPTPTPA